MESASFKQKIRENNLQLQVNNNDLKIKKKKRKNEDILKENIKLNEEQKSLNANILKNTKKIEEIESKITIKLEEISNINKTLLDLEQNILTSACDQAKTTIVNIYNNILGYINENLTNEFSLREIIEEIKISDQIDNSSNVKNLFVLISCETLFDENTNEKILNEEVCSLYRTLSFDNRTGQLDEYVKKYLKYKSKYLKLKLKLNI